MITGSRRGTRLAVKAPSPARSLRDHGSGRVRGELSGLGGLSWYFHLSMFRSDTKIFPGRRELSPWPPTSLRDKKILRGGGEGSGPTGRGRAVTATGDIGCCGWGARRG